MSHVFEQLAADTYRTVVRRPWLLAAAVLYAVAWEWSDLLAAVSGLRMPPGVAAAAAPLLTAVAAAIWAESALADDAGWSPARAAAAVLPFLTFLALLEVARLRFEPFLAVPLAGLASCRFFGSCTLRSFLFSAPEFLALYVGALAACASPRRGEAVLDGLGRAGRALADDPMFAVALMAGGIFLRGLVVKLTLVLTAPLASRGRGGVLAFLALNETSLHLMTLAVGVAAPIHAVRRRFVAAP